MSRGMYFKSFPLHLVFKSFPLHLVSDQQDMMGHMTGASTVPV